MAALNKYHFLIIDDDDVDVLAIKRILIHIDKDIAFSVAHDGEEGLTFLRDARTNKDDPEQFIVLLDLNMPRMGGHEFLQQLRADPELRDTIVFVLSTSNDPRDIKKSYQEFISGYLPKDKLEPEVFKTLFENYLELVTVPAISG